MNRASLKEYFIRAAAIAASVLILAMSLGLHALHNHEADPGEHHDCPVYRYELVLGSSVFFAAFVLIARFTFQKSFLPPAGRPFFFDRPVPHGRGPPS